ncbi:MAG TPA: M20 family metallo-hydrolase [Phycisphaerae bacterium]|nr:M20 family metallo-hydrolase [Phycisphaerae bacterium]
MDVRVDVARLTAELETLAGFSDTELPAVTRVVFSEKDRQARAWLKGICEEAGLRTRTDAIGNFFARWVGIDASAPAVGTGSHTDAIPHSGKFDGTVGVLGGLEAIRALQRAGFRPRRSIELLMFTSEEPTRFGIGCLGSRLLSGATPLERIAELRDKEGKSVDENRDAAGFSGELGSVKLPTGYYEAFVELHIEQGPLLEREGIPVGIVTAIAAPAALRITLEGEGGHAGAVLMPQRRDALCAAAELALFVEAAAKNSGSADSVATTGILRVHPGAINSVPSRCEMEIDVRDTKLEVRDAMVDAIGHGAKEIGAGRKVGVTVEMINADPPATCDARIIDAAKGAAKEMGIVPKMMVSRAYHDSLFMARICPTAMLFIPCRNGVSHRPDEFAKADDIGRGVELLARTMAALAS